MSILLTLGLLASGAHADSAEPMIEVDFTEVTLLELVYWAADTFDVSFVLGDTKALQQDTTTLLSARPIPLSEGWSLFEQAMLANDHAVVFSGGFAKVVPVSEAATAPLEVRVGPPAPVDRGGDLWLSDPILW